MNKQRLKPGWKIVKFGDVVHNANLVERDPLGAGLTRIVGLEHMEPEILHIRRWNRLEDGTSFTRKFVAGQTLFGKRRAYQRKVAYAEFEGICSGDILTFESNDSDVLLPKLLPFICQTDAFFNYALGTSAGSLSPRTSWSALKDFEFSLPPLEEQKRIAEILWAADDVMEKFIYIIDELRKTRQTYLTKLINIQNIGKKWPITQLTTCFKIISGQVDPKKEPYRFMPLVAPNHIEQKTGRFLSIETTDEQNAISGKYLFQPGDVIYSKIRPNLQKAFISNFDGICSADMYPLRPDPQKIRDRYLLAILLSENFTKFAIKMSFRTGIPKLNRQELSKFMIPLPPIHIQDVICSHLKKIDAQEQKLIHHHKNALSLKISLINNFPWRCFI